MLYVVFFNCEIFGNSIIKFLMGEIRKIDFGVDLVRGGRNIVSIIWEILIMKSCVVYRLKILFWDC